MTLCYSFPPAGSRDPFVVILGSMPGHISIQKQEYFAHPRNSFWRIMGDPFGASPETPYMERLKILSDHRIALWETFQSCQREGSADSRIRDGIPNDFNAFFEENPNVRHLFFDGGMAYNGFRRLVLPTLKRGDLALTCLPSTSPRHATMSYQEKLDKWKSVREALFYQAGCV